MATVTYTGKMLSNVTIPAYEGPTHTDEGNINWQGLSGSMEGDWKTIDGQVQIMAPLFEFTEGANQLSVKDLSVDSDGFLSEDGLFLGTSEAGVGAIKLHITDGPMPQTLEHLTIMQILGLQRGMIAVTKIDLVEDHPTGEQGP